MGHFHGGGIRRRCLARNKLKKSESLQVNVVHPITQRARISNDVIRASRTHSENEIKQMAQILDQAHYFMFGNTVLTQINNIWAAQDNLLITIIFFSIFLFYLILFFFDVD